MAMPRNLALLLHRIRSFKFLRWVAIGILEIGLGASILVSPLIGGGLLLAVTVVLLIGARPEFTVYIYALFIKLTPVFMIRLLTQPLNLTHLTIIGGCFSWFLIRMARLRPHYPGSKWDVPLLCFAAWTLLTLSWSHNRTLGIEDIIRLYISIAGFFLVVATVRKRKTLVTVLGILIAVGTIDSIIAILYPFCDYVFIKQWNPTEFLSMHFVFWTQNLTLPGGRGWGFGNAHTTAATMAICITFAMMFFFVTPNINKRRLLILLVIVMHAASVGTLSKGPFLSLIIGSAYVIFHMRPLRQRFFTLMLVIFLLSVASFVFTRIGDLGTAGHVLGENVKVASDDPEMETSVGVRAETWRIGIQTLWETRGVGTGVGGFNQYLPWEWVDGTHPVILFDLGVIGFILWAWLLLSAYKYFMTTIVNCKSEYYKRMLFIYLAGYITILISWIVSFSYIHVYLWFYIGVGFAIAHIAQSATPDSDGNLPFSESGGSIVLL